MTDAERVANPGTISEQWLMVEVARLRAALQPRDEEIARLRADLKAMQECALKRAGWQEEAQQERDRLTERVRELETNL